jgi:NAD(P)-dependent dehydrogenase (short-subunit alcohol dehydrogenase family)
LTGPMDLVGAVVVVTGAGRGLGAAVATELGRRGAVVVGVGRDPSRLTAVGAGSVHCAELRDPGAAEAIVRHAIDTHGRLDAIVANAGVGHAGDLAGMSPERVAELIEVNLTAPILLTRAALPVMRAARTGTLLYVTSIAGAVGVPGENVYSTTKAGLESFADTLRAEVHRDGLRVCSVLPGVLDTGFFETRGRPYDRRFPRPIPAAAAAKVVVDTLAGGADRVFVPRWLAGPARLRAVAPGLYRAMERRFG